jgi:lysophospholipase L1-like esterase
MKLIALLIFFLLSFSSMAADEASRNVILRGSYHNSLLQFKGKKSGRVAFMGGSITQMNGYRPMVAARLKKLFPETMFEFINAGISSTCSTTGAFRLRSQVLEKGKIDLFFIEFAVNDDQDAGHAYRECLRGMEGIIRQARSAQPKMDIVVTYFVNPGMLKDLQSGKMPVPMAAHEAVLKKYGVSTIFLAREVADRIKAGTLTWKEFGGTHPGPAGNAIAAQMIGSLLKTAWSKPVAQAQKDHPMPSEAIDQGSYFNGAFLSPGGSANDDWKWQVPNWKEIPGGFRGTFAGMKLLCSERSGSETSVKFKGSALGAYVLAGPDAGVVEVSMDGGPWKRVELYHRFSRGLHYPRTVMFAADLEPKEHTARLRLAKNSNPAGKGVAARILQFTVN